MRERSTARPWLVPVALAANSGFNARELRRIESVVRARRRESAVS
ncbi:MAG: DUF4160 domain-containing protein [Planctomycetes bacterium]|nr:DUF4160 domain-containing protein [Planctomycetota bacterium]